MEIGVGWRIIMGTLIVGGTAMHTWATGWEICRKGRAQVNEVHIRCKLIISFQPLRIYLLDLLNNLVSITKPN